MDYINTVVNKNRVKSSVYKNLIDDNTELNEYHLFTIKEDQSIYAIGLNIARTEKLIYKITVPSNIDISVKVIKEEITDEFWDKVYNYVLNKELKLRSTHPHDILKSTMEYDFNKLTVSDVITNLVKYFNRNKR